MKAIVFDKYGSPDVLELQDIDKPVVIDDDMLVQVHVLVEKVLGAGFI